MRVMMLGIISISFLIGLVVVIVAPTFWTGMLGATVVMVGMIYALERLIFNRIEPIKTVKRK